MEHTIKTNQREQMLDITDIIREDIVQSKIQDGIAIIYVPHTTAGITINENADSDVVADLLFALKRLVPKDENYKHIEGNSDAHLKASLIGSSCSVIIENGKLKLGTWQGIYFCEFDGPRTRKFYTKFLA